MLRECDICHEEFEDKYMEHYNTGRKTVWLCWECYQNSQREATQSDLHRQRRLYKIHESKRTKK